MCRVCSILHYENQGARVKGLTMAEKDTLQDDSKPSLALHLRCSVNFGVNEDVDAAEMYVHTTLSI